MNICAKGETILFCSENITVYRPPENLYLRLDRIHKGVIELEYDTGLTIADDDSLDAITNCIIYKDNAKLELEYHFLNLARSYKEYGDYPQLNDFLNFMVSYGQELLFTIENIGLYINGIFPYAYKSRRFNTLHFIRRDVQNKIIKQELKSDGLYM